MNDCLENKLELPELTFDEKNLIIKTNNPAYRLFRKFGWGTLEKLNRCVGEFGKKTLDGVFYAKRKGIETNSISKLRIKTDDNRWLTLENLNTYIEEGYSKVTFEKAEIKDYKLKGTESDICFQGRKNFNCQEKPWLDYVLKYILENTIDITSDLEHKIEIDMTNVENIEKAMIDFMKIIIAINDTTDEIKDKAVTKNCKSVSLILSNPHKEIFEKLISAGFPSGNIIGYEEHNPNLSNVQDGTQTAH